MTWPSCATIHFKKLPKLLNGRFFVVDFVVLFVVFFVYFLCVLFF